MTGSGAARIVRASLLQQLQLTLGGTMANPVSPVVQLFGLTGDVDVDALRNAFTAMARRHEALRMRFPSGLRPRSAVLDPIGPTTWEIATHDLRTLPAADAARRLTGLAAGLGHGFDLGNGPLREAVLIRMADRRWVLGLAIDHLVVDGGSLGIFWRDFSVSYAGGQNAHAGPGPEAPAGGRVDFLGCADDEFVRLCGTHPSPEARHWAAALAGRGRLMPELCPRAKYLRADPAPGPHVTAGRTLPASVWRKVVDRARQRRISPYVALVGAAAAAMRGVSTSDTVGFRMPVNARNRAEVEQVVGPFVPSMPLFVDVPLGSSADELLATTRAAVLPLIAHAMPFNALRAHYREIGPVPIGSDPALRAALGVPHAVFMADLDMPPGPDLPGVDRDRIEPPRHATVTGSPMLTVQATPDGGGMRIAAGGSTGIYHPELLHELVDAMADGLYGIAVAGQRRSPDDR